MNSISKPELVIRKASSSDLPVLTKLLESVTLPTAGLADHVGNFLVAESCGIPIGSIGLEVYGDTALVRSAAVLREFQGKGIGERMYGVLVSYARELGVKELVLLTTTAEGYFQRRGFETVDRESVTGAVTASREFKDACPASATVMRKKI